MSMEKVIIIGSGPAGHTAAIYAARAELTPLLFEGRIPGGQLMLTTEVENFPGFPGGAQGPEMMELFRKQSQRFGTRIVADDVVAVDFSVRPFLVKTADAEYHAESLIVSTGATAMWLDVPGEKKYGGRGVSACATCDGFFFKGKKIIVVGGGDSAMEEATFLTRFAESVTVIVRREELRASKIMQERARANSKILFVWNSEVKEIVGDGTRVTGVKLFDNKTNVMSELATDGVFVAIGHKPNTELFAGKLELDTKGYVVTQPHSTRTSVEGVFAAGDVADHYYRQAITAAGTGCMAAIDAERWLASRE
ncbi:thioredoxin-disulfide reductase [Candidatus Uhrbacteria bacterium RIFOXYB12_FULL_58_10]|uniref:Thioredoxin reductase n=1 Tax=Candidatus Uhrbacteria bacterium RIFOXYB2_FULL_57_15 TaxID=1802422 RepID=A0A1F7W7P5_9BACT|nr:MAG: thioredoxin-disulfide reductase [Candidatus Uhrbacteria bacterium RIFOXYB12_FULL_58_10]OGL98823.1 MAG: thioredoxin-disulfide reductase [Candidatus Uhrbacteria bacterium RIFOXYB2_FULL_57_15]OGL99766.1 MAG: thioredoxin-disulfide reductase [Candidatus Uhrbacteria bacterium RIFOXYC12_FULL_57_11]